MLKIAAANAECRGFCDADATRAMLEMENDAMGLMAQAGVSVPEPLPAKDGSKIVRLEQLGGVCEEKGTCFVRLITFLDGTLLAEIPEYVVTHGQTCRGCHLILCRTVSTVRRHPTCLLRRFGACLGRMDLGAWLDLARKLDLFHRGCWCPTAYTKRRTACLVSSTEGLQARARSAGSNLGLGERITGKRGKTIVHRYKRQR